jgi:molybdopterin synthase catalytic subunit
MKIFTTDCIDDIGERLAELGKLAIVEKHGEEVKIISDKISFNAEVELQDAFEILADIGIDFAFVRGFDNSFPKVNTVEEILNLKDFESLKSLIRKVKKAGDAEKCGAIGVFIGFVRKLSGGREVIRLEYEENEELFDKKLEEIQNRLKAHPGVVEAKIFHKSGTIFPGEDIIYVVVMGEHRKSIWRPLEESMELVKRELPVWKKEVYVDGEEWAHDMK